MGILARFIAELNHHLNKPPVHYCPYCFSKNVEVLGSNAARFQGNVCMVFTCLSCGEDSMYNIYRGGGSSGRLQPCAKQARVVDHSRAEIWDEKDLSADLPDIPNQTSLNPIEPNF